MSNFWQRLVTGVIIVSVIIGSIIFGPISFIILFLIVALLSLYEFYNLVSSDALKPQKGPGLVLGMIIYTAISFSWPEALSVEVRFAFIFALTALIFFIELYRKKVFPFHSIAYTLTGVIYIIIPFAMLIRISFLSGNYNYAVPLGIFLLIWTHDTFAYLAGIKFGKHRLFERLSPKKSWEGFAGGLVAAMIVSYILFNQFAMLSLYEWLALALIVVVTGTLGDLVKSMLKRSLNVKDSGTILPGHGGLIDRFDAVLMSVPFIYIYLSMIK